MSIQAPHAETLAKPSAKPWAKELRIAAIAIIGSFLVMPAIIYAVGTPLLGAYSGGKHIGAFYVDIVKHLASGTLRTWFIVLAPYLLVSAWRIIFWRWKSTLPVPQNGPQQDLQRAEIAQNTAQKPAPNQRREPFITP